MSNAITDLAQVPMLRDPRYGSIRELVGFATNLPELGLAVADVDVGATSPHHFHKRMSEAYYILEGRATMWLDGESFAMLPGQSVSIAPGVVHAIANPGPGPLRFLVATAPAYDEDDDIEVET